MKVTELNAKLNGEIINLDEDLEIESGYAGDFLSFVMGKAPDNSAWFTVMSNVNVVAVAALTGVAVVVICEGVEPDEQLINTAKTKFINVIKTKYDVYNAIKVAGDLV